MSITSPSAPAFPANATLTTRVHDALETAIIAGELKPGERIHADVLAAQFGMSRIPVREALRSLHEAGWVDIKPRHGVHVRERTAEELGELFEFRAVVEGVVARWAALRRTDADLDLLAARIKESRDASDERASGAGFYAALRAAARNSVLATTSAALEKRARFYFSTVAHELGEDWRHVHEEVLEHVRAQDADAAERVAHQHIEDTGTAVAALLFEK
ncbi:transcriptional regulator [Mycolicibacterium aurum]|uniref:Transcriptional regulator n=1 Tax=Mycolicibacterium aurum TaxID=1791 RepID=A0A3S4TAZ5_MYCAU|nr:GntR family transcriptional regulator [Mycolicibacterium aurum]VEG55032.1 transcriptional regulator [Mycolicibacterium aurum]